MDQGVWYDRDWMISTITHPARNAHGPLFPHYLQSAQAGTKNGHLKYFIRKAEMIEFDYTARVTGRVSRRRKRKYFYMKGPDPC